MHSHSLNAVMATLIDPSASEFTVTNLEMIKVTLHPLCACPNGATSCCWAVSGSTRQRSLACGSHIATLRQQLIPRLHDPVLKQACIAKKRVVHVTSESITEVGIRQ